MARTTYPAVGRYRQIRLKPEPNAAGNYELLYYLAGVGTRRESTSAKTWAEAEAYRDQFIADAKAELAAVGPASQTRFTVDQLCDRWLTWAEAQGKHRNNAGHLRQVRAVLGGYHWDTLTTNP